MNEPITDAMIAEWQAERGYGMTSAVGEYTPSEFWLVLDELVRLRAAREAHWTDKHIHHLGNEFHAFDEAGLELDRFASHDEARDRLVAHAAQLNMARDAEAQPVLWRVGHPNGVTAAYEVERIARSVAKSCSGTVEPLYKHPPKADAQPDEDGAVNPDLVSLLREKPPWDAEAPALQQWDDQAAAELLSEKFRLPVSEALNMVAEISAQFSAPPALKPLDVAEVAKIIADGMGIDTRTVRDIAETICAKFAAPAGEVVGWLVVSPHGLKWLLGEKLLADSYNHQLGGTIHKLIDGGPV